MATGKEETAGTDRDRPEEAPPGAEPAGASSGRPRYDPEAYEFVRRSLDRAQILAGEHRHVSGPELLLGLRDLALEEYGLLARAVLASWGIGAPEDVGAIVFELIEARILSRTEEDRITDFHGALDFGPAFDEGYRW